MMYARLCGSMQEGLLSQYWEKSREANGVSGRCHKGFLDSIEHKVVLRNE